MNDRVAQARLLGYLTTKQSERWLCWRYLDEEVRRRGFGVVISTRRRYADVIVVAGERVQLDEESKRETVELGRRYFKRARLFGWRRSGTYGPGGVGPVLIGDAAEVATAFLRLYVRQPA